MRTAPRAVVAALTLALAGPLLIDTPAHGAAPITCQGMPATVVGSTGTEGDDVMVVVPTQATTARALGGNDTICIVAAPEGAIRSVVVDAGAGDDSVLNESADVDDVWYTTVLGTGADSYVGLDSEIPDDPQASPFVETVYSGQRDLTGPALDGSSDTEIDRIDTRGGDDVVHSGTTTPGAINNDTVLTGTGDDTVEWAGEQRGSGVTDLGTGDNTLALHPGWQGTSTIVSGPARAAVVDGRAVLRWAGSVVRYDLSIGTRDQTFAGTNADETLVLAPREHQAGSAAAGGRRVIEMGGGDDHLALHSLGSGRVTGGPGRDSYSGVPCSTARVRVGGTFTCESTAGSAMQQSFDFDDFEDLQVEGGDVTVLGSDADEKIKVVAGLRIRVRGRGGDDVLNANTSGHLRGARAVLLTGGTGADRVVGSFARDRLLGGRGNDTLFGDGGNDAILGGPGRDKAFGQQGHDRCSADVRRSCER
jgi:Ca2+-binding RTX toxin-like protein